MSPQRARTSVVEGACEHHLLYWYKSADTDKKARTSIVEGACEHHLRRLHPGRVADLATDERTVVKAHYSTRVPATRRNNLPDVAALFLVQPVED
jgi:hypothetical protein